MRFVLFDGEVTHGIQESTHAPEIETWRVSYVIRIFLNPRRPNQSLRADLFESLAGANAALRNRST